MIVYPLGHWPNGRDIEFVIRLERAISRLGAPLGFDGDPLAENCPEPKTHEEIVAACDLLQALPARLRNWDRRVAHRMCKRAVFGRTRDDIACTATVKPTVTEAKLNRERRRVSA